MHGLARAVAFVLGVVILVLEVAHECIRTPVIILALLLMGVLSVDQLRELLARQASGSASPPRRRDGSSSSLSDSD